MSPPRVSVVMSVYNGQRHLARAVESILRQSFVDFEFLIVNDGSTDATSAILAEAAARDSRVRIIVQANAGLTIAVRTGCAQARGEYIARQDADDWSAPTRLESLVKELDDCPAVVMASSWAASVDDEGQLVERSQHPADPQSATHQLLYERCGPPAHGSVMFRRRVYEQVGGYRACFYYGQDSDLWLRMANHGSIVYVPEELYYFRLSPGGISGAKADWQSQFGELGQLSHAARLRGESEEPFLAQAEALKRAMLSTHSRRSQVQRLQAAAHYRIGTQLGRSGNAGSKRHFWMAVRLNPLHWRSWCRLGFELVRVRRTHKEVEVPASR